MRTRWARLAMAAILLGGTAGAQVRQVDPDRALDGDPALSSPRQPSIPRPSDAPVPPEDAPAVPASSAAASPTLTHRARIAASYPHVSRRCARPPLAVQ